MSALFRFVSTSRPTTSSGSCRRSRAETQGDSTSAGVCTHSPRARTVWPVDAQWGAEQDLLLHGARDLLPRVVCSHQGNGYE